MDDQKQLSRSYEIARREMFDNIKINDENTRFAIIANAGLISWILINRDRADQIVAMFLPWLPLLITFVFLLRMIGFMQRIQRFARFSHALEERMGLDAEIGWQHFWVRSNRFVPVWLRSVDFWVWILLLSLTTAFGALLTDATFLGRLSQLSD